MAASERIASGKPMICDACGSEGAERWLVYDPMNYGYPTTWFFCRECSARLMVDEAQAAEVVEAWSKQVEEASVVVSAATWSRRAE